MHNYGPLLHGQVGMWGGGVVVSDPAARVSAELIINSRKKALTEYIIFVGGSWQRNNFFFDLL